MEEVLSVSVTKPAQKSFFANEYINNKHRFWNPVRDIDELLTEEEKRLLQEDNELDGDFYDMFKEEEKESFLKAVFVQPRENLIFFYEYCDKDLVLIGFFNISYSKVNIRCFDVEADS